ncbi:ADP-ribose pyrophosphatase [plant metagenome]|uniref:ADP-ribose pyrophosphatase n=1 Tax=plant metagenome TaxID=1297885 RepID=A0A484NTW7_9ZZZZ
MSDTSTSHLVETCLDSQTVYEGRFLKVCRDSVRLPDGREGSREYVKHPGAVVVIPLLDDGRVLLERQYRYPVQRTMIEFPAGKLDPGEDPLVCGQRELREETGYRARQWAHAGGIHLAIGYSDEIIHVYFARGLSLGERDLDPGEFLDVWSATPAALLAACARGEVTDAKTLSCVLWLQNVLSGAWQLDWRDA